MISRSLFSCASATKRGAQPLISRATPAGPSRLPSCRLNTTSTRPVPSEDITDICLRAEMWPSMLHVYAALRAVESRLGTVIDIEVPRNPDTLQSDRFVFLSLLHPIKLAEPIRMEIPPPSMSGESSVFGGPSWVDICRVLSESHSDSRPAAAARQKGKDETRIVDRSIRFSVEKREGPIRSRGKARLGRLKASRTKKELEEDAEIIEALRALGPGAYGGFEGLAEKLSHLESVNGNESSDSQPSVASEPPAAV